MKLMLAYGRRPLCSYRSLLPESRAAGAAPETAHRVPIFPVPFRPLGGEVADLIAAFAEVPRLSNELHLRQDRVLVDDVEERPKLVHGVQLTSQRARQVEAESVDVHLAHPVAQRIHDQLQ